MNSLCFGLLLVCLFPVLVSAQEIGQPELNLNWEELNISRLTSQKRALWTLGGWAAANIVVGVGASFASQGHWKHFHQFNAAWNSVNLALAGFGLRDVYAADPAAFSGLETLQEIESLQKILLLNTGLDLAYLAVGGWLVTRAQVPDVKRPDMLKGFGNSLFLQGGFLLVFDSVFYLVLNSPRKQSLKWLEQLTVTGLGVNYTF